MREVHNIAIFGHKRIPSREGGVEIVVRNWVHAWFRRAIM